MSNLVEIKSYISQAMHKELVQECGLCGCKQTEIVRQALAREIQRRRAERKRNADNAVLAGQMEIGGGV